MPSHYDGTEQERLALTAYITLMRCAESVTRRLSPLLAGSGLTETQFGVLEALYHLGSMNQSQLGAKTLKSSGNMTLVVDNLEKRRLARRERSTVDRRVVVVHLTAEGRSLVAGLMPAHAANVVAEFDLLTSDEQEELRRLCKKVGIGVPS
ncbi:MAG: MarR family transcriptional regulator [Candidatus Poribacteria bacterium]